MFETDLPKMNLFNLQLESFFMHYVQISVVHLNSKAETVFNCFIN